MQIANMLGTSTASALEAIYGEEERKQKAAKRNEIFSRQQDSVSISPEALQAYQTMRCTLEEASSTDGMTEEEKNLPGDMPHEAAAGGSSSGSGGSATVAEIETKIKELQQKMMQIQNSGMPEESKNAMTTSIQAQINELMQQLNGLQAKAA